MLLSVHLRRVLVRADVEKNEPCALCAIPMPDELSEMVVAEAKAGGHTLGNSCRRCLGYLHWRSPESFLSLVAYADACRKYTTPVFESEAEAARVGEDKEAFLQALEEADLSCR